MAAPSRSKEIRLSVTDAKDLEPGSESAHWIAYGQENRSPLVGPWELFQGCCVCVVVASCPWPLYRWSHSRHLEEVLPQSERRVPWLRVSDQMYLKWASLD